MFYNQIRNYVRTGDNFAAQNRFGEAAMAYKQARGGIRSSGRADEHAQALMIQLTVNIISCVIQEKKRDLSLLDWCELTEMSGECRKVAAKIQETQLQKMNQENGVALEYACLVKAYSEDVALLNGIDWDLFHSIHNSFDTAIQRLGASEMRFRNAGYEQEAQEVVGIITLAYEKKGEAFFNISGDVYGLEPMAYHLRGSFDAYNTALQRVNKPSFKTILAALNVGAELSTFLHGAKKQRIIAERKQIYERYKDLFENAPADRQLEMLMADYQIQKEMHQGNLLDTAGQIIHLVEQNESLHAKWPDELLEVRFFYMAEHFNQAMRSFAKRADFDLLRAVVVLRTIGDNHGRYPMVDPMISDHFLKAAASLGDQLANRPEVPYAPNLNYREVFAQLISRYTGELTSTFGKEEGIKAIKDLFVYLGLFFLSDDHTRIDFSQESGPILNEAAYHFFKASADLSDPRGVKYIQLFQRVDLVKDDLVTLLQTHKKDSEWIHAVSAGYSWSSTLPSSPGPLPQIIQNIRQSLDPNDFLSFAYHIEGTLKKEASQVLL